MPGARPSPRQPVCEEHSRQGTGAVLGWTRREAAVAGARTRTGGPLVRRAVGLVLGMAVLIPAATALDGSHGPHGGHPIRPQSVTAAAPRR
jgi:hypothetical protein